MFIILFVVFVKDAEEKDHDYLSYQGITPALKIIKTCGDTE